MPEKLPQNVSKQSKVDQVLYGIGGTLKKLPEAHERVFMAVYDEFFAPKPKTEEEKHVALVSRQKVEKWARLAGWGASSVEVGLVALSVIKGFSLLKKRASSSLLFPTQTTRIDVVAPPVVAAAEKEVTEFFPGTLAPKDFDMAEAKKKFGNLYDALHMRISKFDDEKADALFVAAAAFAPRHIEHNYGQLITNIDAIHFVLQNMDSHPEVVRELVRYLPERTGGIKVQNDFYRNPLNIVRDRFRIISARPVRFDATSPIEAWNWYDRLGYAALGKFFGVRYDDPGSTAMMQVFKRVNPLFAWGGDLHTIRKQ